MFHRSTANLLLSVFFGLIILVTGLAIYVLSTLLYIFNDIRRWAIIQMRIISGQLKTILRTDDSHRLRSIGRNRAHQIGSSSPNPFASLSPGHFLHQTHPGSPHLDRARRARTETTPSRPSGSRPARRPRRLLVARSPSQTLPPPYLPSMAMLPESELTQDQTMGTAVVESMTAPKAGSQSETVEPHLTVQTDQSQAEPPIPLSSLVNTPPIPLSPLVTPPSPRSSLVDTLPPSQSPLPSDQLEREG